MISVVILFLSSNWKKIIAVLAAIIFSFGIGFIYGNKFNKEKQDYKNSKEIISRLNEENKVLEIGNKVKEEFVTFKHKTRNDPTKLNKKKRDEFYTCLLSNDIIKNQCMENK